MSRTIHPTHALLLPRRTRRLLCSWLDDSLGEAGASGRVRSVTVLPLGLLWVRLYILVPHGLVVVKDTPVVEHRLVRASKPTPPIVRHLIKARP